MKHLLQLLLIALVLPPVAASALTLDEARLAAAERYPLMRDYNLIALTEQYTVANAAKAWLPQVQIGAQGTWQSAVASYPQALTQMLEQRGVEMKGLGKWQYKATLDVSQTIWDGGAIGASQEVARAEARESALTTDVEMYNLRGRIDQLYFSILLLELQRDALNSTLDLLNANMATVSALLANGAAMQSDADAVEVERLSAQQQLESVQSSIASYRQVLALYTGRPADEPMTVPADTPPEVGNDFVLRPEAMLFDARMATIEARRSQVKASVMPRIGAFAQGYYGYPGMDFMEAMMNRRPTLNALVGIRASWDIGSLYTRKNRLSTLDAQRDRLTLARETFDFNSSLQTTRQRHEIDRLQAIAASDSRIVQLRAGVRQASEAQLREGVATPAELLRRITDEKNAMIAANSHRIEYLMAVYQLNYLLNR